MSSYTVPVFCPYNGFAEIPPKYGCEQNQVAAFFMLFAGHPEW